MAGLLLGLFGFALAMAHFGALHRLVHADADQSHHSCVVTLLATGQVDVAGGEMSVTFLPVVVAVLVMPAVPTFVAVDYSLLPGRGPPAPRA